MHLSRDARWFCWSWPPGALYIRCPFLYLPLPCQRDEWQWRRTTRGTTACHPERVLCQPSSGCCSLWAYLASRSFTFWTDSLLFVVVMVALCSDSRLRFGLPLARYAMLRVCPHPHPYILLRFSSLFVLQYIPKRLSRSLHFRRIVAI